MSSSNDFAGDQPAEFVVSGNAPLAIAVDVHHREIEMLAVVERDVLQMSRVVVGVTAPGWHAERIEQVRHGQPFGDGRGAHPCNLEQRPLFEQTPGDD